MIQFDPSVGFVSEGTVVEAELRLQVDQLQESWDEAASALLRLRTEDEGWSILGQVKKDDGFSLRVLQDVAKKSEVQATGNPLLKSAFDLRFNPIFSRGFELATEDGQKIKPRFQKKLDNISVQEVLFSEDGYELLERTCFNVGNVFVVYNRDTGDLQRIPFSEISNRAVDPDMPGRTAYYQWTHTRYDFDGKSTPVTEYIPVVEWWKEGKDTIDKIGQIDVNHSYTIIDQRVNVPTTGHWGIPDAFPALPYAWAYSEYIRDAASVLKAFNVIAWKIVGKSKTQAQTAGVSLAGQRKAGGIAAMTAGTDLAAMPKAGQVDMADGRALAAMVASATGVSTNALLATTDSTSVAVQSLDGPTVAMARSRQKRWMNFYRRVFLAMGVEGLLINFPKITEDPIHRQISSLSTVRTVGGIWADEYREAVLEALSVNPLHDTPPDVEEYAQAQNALGFMTAMENAVNGTGSAQLDPLSRQGNAGVSGKLSGIDNTNRNLDTAAGNGSQTGLVG